MRIIILIFAFIFLSFDVLSAECMEHFNNNVSNGRYYKMYWDDGVQADENCQYTVVMSSYEYATLITEAETLNFLNSVTATLIELFEFSVEDFAYFNAICLIGFISGHSIGRVLRLLGKT